MSNRARHCTVVIRIQIETVRCCTLKHALDKYDSMLLIETCSPPLIGFVDRPLVCFMQAKTQFPFFSL